MFGLELYDSLKRYKEFNVYFRYLHFISKDDIESYDAVIPIDVDTQNYYNSLKSSPFLIKYSDTYSNLDNKSSCFEIVKKYKQINHIPTLTNKSKTTIKEFINSYPADKYIIKNTKGYAAYYQHIISREILLTKTNVNLSNSILQPKFDNFELYSLDAICKDGVIKTPKLSHSILDGVTRDSVCKIVTEILEMKLEETDLYIDDLLEADEVFCTGTAVVVAPVGKITFGKKIVNYNKGKIGPITQKCKDTLTSIQRQEIDDPFNWIQPVMSER